MIRRFSLLLASLFVLLPASAMAVSLEQAEKFYEDAKKLSDSGQHDQALELYVKAYSTYPQAKYVFGIAGAYVQLGNLPGALDAYEMFNQYDPTPEVLERVQAEIKKLKEMLSREYGEVYLFSSPSKVQIFIGEFSKHNMYTTPVRRWVKAGKQTVLFKKDGFLPRELNLQVEEGDHLYIYTGLKPEKK